MRRQSVIPQKKRGPPATGKGAPIMVRVQPNQLAALDHWIARQENAPTRPEAIRQLMDFALAGSDSARPTSEATVEKAAELAARAIEKTADKSQPAKEQQTRKRRLIKGPSEFRDIRRDQPKRKIVTTKINSPS
jgi:hypothetical protein